MMRVMKGDLEFRVPGMVSKVIEVDIYLWTTP